MNVDIDIIKSAFIIELKTYKQYLVNIAKQIKCDYVKRPNFSIEHIKKMRDECNKKIIEKEIIEKDLNSSIIEKDKLILKLDKLCYDDI